MLLKSLAGLVDGHPEIREWILHDRNPSVRIRKPRDHPGLALIVSPFVMETEVALKVVDAGAADPDCRLSNSARLPADRTVRETGCHSLCIPSFFLYMTPKIPL